MRIRRDARGTGRFSPGALSLRAKQEQGPQRQSHHEVDACPSVNQAGILL